VVEGAESAVVVVVTVAAPLLILFTLVAGVLVEVTFCQQRQCTFSVEPLFAEYEPAGHLRVRQSSLVDETVAASIMENLPSAQGIRVFAVLAATVEELVPAVDWQFAKSFEPTSVEHLPAIH